jgi:hypothetical protein
MVVNRRVCQSPVSLPFSCYSAVLPYAIPGIREGYNKHLEKVNQLSAQFFLAVAGHISFSTLAAAGASFLEEGRICFTN